MLGVLKAGGAFTPLDPSHPVGRLRSLVLAVDAKIVLCSRHHVELLATVSDMIIPVDEEVLEKPPIDQIKSTDPVQPNNAAYVIFTSGSTGEPKV